jgi:IS30 family transposase
MPPGKRLSDYERGQIDSKADLGWTQRAIATSINRSVTVVNHYLRDRENYGKKNAGGRP